MRSLVFIAASTLVLSACDMNGQDGQENSEDVAAARSDNDYGYDTFSTDNFADSMASDDEAYRNGNASEGEQDIEDPEDRPMMQLQVVLDRLGFGPGVIDGEMGMSTENALLGFQEANDLETTGEFDAATKTALSEWNNIPATRVVTVPESWENASYTDIPDDPEAQAEMDRLGYSSLDERLAERFHTTIDVLKQLNPDGLPAGASGAGDSAAGSSPDDSTAPETSKRTNEPRTFFRAGQQVRVPNIGADRITPGSIDDRGWQQTLASLGVGSDQPEVVRIVVSKSGKTLRAFSGEELVALFTVSSGSSQFPLPIGEWDIVGEAYNPPYSYDPEVLGEGEGETYELPPGPNGPVGVVWIDLSKEHYGIHGTPEPETIGRAQSSGCVRLTNWDAARLSQMVSQSTQVIFES